MTALARLQPAEGIAAMQSINAAIRSPSAIRLAAWARRDGHFGAGLNHRAGTGPFGERSGDARQGRSEGERDEQFRRRLAAHERADLARSHDPRQRRAYAPYLYEEGIRPLEEKALGVQMFREDRETESEFVTISYWESVDAMSRFTGGDPTHPSPR